MSEKISDVDPKTLKEWMDAGEVTLIDVREPKEFSWSYIHTAKFFPLSSFNAEGVPFSKGKPLVFYCAAGVRSKKAANLWLEKYGDDVGMVFSLMGGINKWKEYGHPLVFNVEENDKIPTQAYFLFGALTLIGSVLAMFLSLGFLVLPVLSSLVLLLTAFKGADYLVFFLAKLQFLIPRSFR